MKIAVTGNIQSGSGYFDFNYPLALARDPVNNTLGIAYRSYSANGNTAYVNIAFSTNDGQTWASQQLVSEAVSTNDYCCIDLALYNGAVYEMYYIGSSGPLELATGTETTAPSTWSIQHSYQVSGYPDVVPYYSLALDSTGTPAVVITRTNGTGSGTVPTYFWRPIANTIAQVITDLGFGQGGDGDSDNYAVRLTFFGTQPIIVYNGARNGTFSDSQQVWLAYSTTGAAGTWTVTNVPAPGGADGESIGAPFGIAAGSVDQVTVVSTISGGNGSGCGNTNATLATTTNFTTWTLCAIGGANGPEITSLYPTVRYGVNDALFVSFVEPDDGDPLPNGVYVWSQYANGPCTYSLATTTQTVGPSAGSYSFVLNAPTGCSWVAQSDTSWITLTSGATGSGTTTINFNVAANTGSTALTGTLTVAGITYTVVQNSTASCTYSLQPASATLTAAAQSGTVGLTTTSGCGWAASTTTSWLTVTSAASGSGSATIDYSATANTGAARNGSLTIAGQTFNITQSAPCTYTLSPTSATVSATAQTGFVTLTTGAACSWTAATTTSWLTVTSAASGTGPATIDYSVAANTTSSQLSGSLSIGGVTFPITQNAGTVTCTYSLQPTSATDSAAAQTGAVALTTQTGCAWTASTATSWLGITSAASGSGSTTVNYSVAANTTGVQRTGFLSIGGQTFTVTQNSTSVTCTYSLSTNSASFSAAASSSTVTVTAPSGCAWTAASSNTWLTITAGASGSGNGTVSYSVGQNTSVQQFGSLTIAGITFAVEQAAPPMLLTPVTPCRVADTRNATGPFGGPTMSGNSTRTFTIPQSACNIPATALAYSLNVTVVPPGPLTYLSIWPAGQAQPVVSTLNSFNGEVVANAAIVPAGTNGAIDVYVSNTTDVVIDINGYFVASGTAGALSFYPVTPCRVADTRNATGSLGGPFMSSGTTRAFPITSSSCGLPSTAQAYSFNVTVVPHQALNYLTIWPTGQSQPYVSTLNSPLGAIVANAAIVPAGSGGEISIFVTDNTDVIIDVNGYFAPPGTGGLSLYTLTPCRVVDTRSANGLFGSPSMTANTTRSFPIPSSSCGAPSNALAYSLNVTVVPAATLGYLTIWPTSVAQPYVSTLNSPLGQVVANAAIVPAGSAGAVSIYVTDTTDLILDINGYFGQ